MYSSAYAIIYPIAVQTYPVYSLIKKEAFAKQMFTIYLNTVQPVFKSTTIKNASIMNIPPTISLSLKTFSLIFILNQVVNSRNQRY